MPLIIILLIIIGLIAAYIAMTYNFFVITKTRIQAQIEELGNQLKRRAELIPQIADIIEINTDQEKKVYQMITDARKNVSQADQERDPEKLIEASNQVERAIGSIQVLVESNHLIERENHQKQYVAIVGRFYRAYPIR